MNIFNSLLAQLVKYDVHTTHKINSIHAIFYHILSFYLEHIYKIWHSIVEIFNAIKPSTCHGMLQNLA